MKYQDYLPDTFRQTAEYTALGAAVDEPVAEWENEVAALPQEYFPTTAESRLGRWEKVLGLTSTGTIEQRRFAVISRLAGVRPYTIVQLRRQLTAAMGKGQFTAEVFPDEFLLRVEVAPESADLLDAMGRELRRMIPANIVLETAVWTEQTSEVWAGAVLAVSDRVSLTADVPVMDNVND